MIKQVIVVRTDLNMRKGKMCAQVAHASMKVFFDRMYENIDDIPYSNSDFHCDFTIQMIKWKNGSFVKIVVGCNSEQELFSLQKQAEEASIVNAIILDNGNTEFKQACPICMQGHKTKCMTCDGSGKEVYLVYDTTEELPPTALRDCKVCKGTGEKRVIPNKDCDACKGTGDVNKPTYTCLAIGPDESEKIDKITGHLKLI